jgi:hypothetical protein
MQYQQFQWFPSGYRSLHATRAQHHKSGFVLISRSRRIHRGVAAARAAKRDHWQTAHAIPDDAADRGGNLLLADIAMRKALYVGKPESRRRPRRKRTMACTRQSDDREIRASRQFFTQQIGFLPVRNSQVCPHCALRPQVSQVSNETLCPR